MSEGWARNVLERCMGLRPGERLLVIVDSRLTSAGLELQRQGWELGAAESSVRVLELQQALMAVDQSFLSMVQQADVVISMLGFVDLRQEIPALRGAVTQFRKAQHGRWAFGALIDDHVLHNELMADYREVGRIATLYASHLMGVDHVRLVDQRGTNLSFRIGGRPIHAETGILTKPGSFGNLPAGETFVAPIETSAEGTLVVDLAIADLVLDGPVTFRFREGRVIGVEGGVAAVELKRRLAEDETTAVLGEFGIGANPYAHIRGRATTDEKVLGTIHIALGSNRQFGGLHLCDHHYDCVSTLPQILLDGKAWRPQQERRPV